MPRQPADSNEAVVQAPEATGQDEGGRPIPPPPVAPTEPGGSGGSGGNGTGGETGGGQGATSWSVRVSDPMNPVGARPGAKVDLVVRVSDPTALITGTALVIARDDDGDQKPDGDPINEPVAVSLISGANTITYDTTAAQPFLVDGYGRFLLGVQVQTRLNETKLAYAPGVLTVDQYPPSAEWISPFDDALVNPIWWNIQVKIEDQSSPATLKIMLDNNTEPSDGFAGVLLGDFTVPKGSEVYSLTVPLSFSAGTYYYYVILSDGITPDQTFYAPNKTLGGGALLRLMVTNRIVGDYPVAMLDPNDPAYVSWLQDGAVLQGFNYNDLGGTVISGVPSVNGDNSREILIGARYGKPSIINDSGVGFGEAYLVYGTPGAKLTGAFSLNSVGTGNLSGLAFRGIRRPLNTTWSAGMSDLTIVPDMDGDNLPEMVFGFPRVESVSLATEANKYSDFKFQHPLLKADLARMGDLEYDAGRTATWETNRSHFARGGIVIVSSQNEIVRDPNTRNRHSDRLVDLHEVGQLFNTMSRPSLIGFPTTCIGVPTPIPDPTGFVSCQSGCVPPGNVGGCPTDPNDPNVPYTECLHWYGIWDVSFTNQGPGGFHQTWTRVPADPPLANPSLFTPSGIPDDIMNCCLECVITHYLVSWDPLPWTTLSQMGSWIAQNGMPPISAWTGFCGPDATPTVTTQTGMTFPAPVGARILGETVDDHFGTTVSADDTWLYIAAPRHDAKRAAIPTLPGDRAGAGIVYMLRTNTAPGPGQPTLAQLWIEPGQSWPTADRELPTRTDYTMPTPHQYIIRTIGSIRGNAEPPITCTTTECDVDYTVEGVRPAYWTSAYEPYNDHTAGYRLAHVAQMVGPHVDARIAYVRALGDVNGDGHRDFAIGSADIKKTVVSGTGAVTFTGPVVGSVFILFGRGTGWEGDYLLEQLALSPGDPKRLHGVLLQGVSASEKLARVFDDAGDFNGDGYADVIVGSENAQSGAGEAIVVLGSRTLESPAGGWIGDAIVGVGRALRFIGENAGDHAGANVTGAGNVDGDQRTVRLSTGQTVQYDMDDILIAAPGADGGTGRVYLIYGNPDLRGSFSLAKVGTVDLPGAVFVGRLVGDQLGGGEKSVPNTDPANRSTIATSRGMGRLGDVNGDGRDDFSISAILASPFGKTNAGEVYILHGRGD
ncbi:MAG: FG-GAP repeat protein [Planctomycetota bacterium]